MQRNTRCPPIINMVETGHNIMRLRKSNGMIVRDLHEIFGFATPQAIYKWQHGAASPIVDNLLGLAAVFGVYMEDIFIIQREVNGAKNTFQKEGLHAF